jgi:Ca-activated chloride channel family protein
MRAERKPRGRFPIWMAVALSIPVLGAYAYLLRDASGFRFAHPWALALLPLGLALCVWAGFLRAPGRAAVLRHARAGELGRMRPGIVARFKDLPGVLRLAVIALVGIAVARPQTSRLEDQIELEGIDIVVVLDASGSMEETDLVPNRMEAAKTVIRNFVERRRSDRLGLVIFGRDAFTYVPLTLDHGTYLRMLGELELGIIDGKGTAIGNGLGVALARLRRSDARSRVVILLTDGDNNAGNISPAEAAKIAQTLGVKVYTILAGRNEAADAPGATGRAGQRYPTNPKLLEQIATMTGGTPYLATDTEALARRFENILADLEKSRIQDRGILYAELFPMFLWPAFVGLLMEVALRLTRLRRLP